MSAIREKLYYFWKKLAEKQTRKAVADVHFKEDIHRYHTCTDRKPAAQIKREMKALHKYWNCYPFQYYRFDLFRNDCTLTFEEMKKYVPHYFMFNLFYPLSFKDYGVLCEDKLMSYAMLKAYQVPQPTILFCYDGGQFYDGSNNSITNAEANAIINASSAAKLFIKPRFGVGGKGIIVFAKKEGRFMSEENTELDHAFFINSLKKDAYVVQEGLIQHDEINQIYPHSVNTVRVFTECINGEARVLYSLLRMGSGGQQVDNASSGGLYTKIDSNTGILGDFAFTTSRDVFMQHPDTHFIFKGAVIEQWQEAKKFALEAAEKFREIKYLGWDVAFTQNGLSIIEMNHHPGLGIVQDWYGGIRDDLKIIPKDWWYKSNYTIKAL